MKTVNAELVKKIAQNIRLDPQDVKKTLDALAFAIPDCLPTVGSKVYIKNVGKFELVHVKEKKTILNEKMVTIPEQDVIVFSISKKMKIQRGASYD